MKTRRFLDRFAAIDILAAIAVIIICVAARSALAWHYELENLAGECRLSLNYYHGTVYSAPLVINHFENSLSAGSSEASIVSDVTSEALSFRFTGVLHEADYSGAYYPLSTIHDIVVRLRVDADPGDPETTVLVVDFAANSTYTSYPNTVLDGSIRVSGNTIPLQCLTGASAAVEGQYFSVANGEIIEVDIDYIQAYLSDLGSNTTTWDLSVGLDPCGSGTSECPKPVVLLVPGAEAPPEGIEVHEEARVQFERRGWEVQSAPQATTLSQLAAMIRQECVRGVHFAAHGSYAVRSAIQLHVEQPDGATIIRPVTAQELSNEIGQKSLDFVAPLSCNQDINDWQAAFRDTREIIPPLKTHGILRIVIGSEQLALVKSGYSADLPPCAAMLKRVNDGSSSSVPIHVVSCGVGRECASFWICEGGLCGNDLFPAMECVEVCGSPVDGSIRASSPNGSFTIGANFEAACQDSVTVLGTAFDMLPAELMNADCVPIGRHVVAGVVGSGCNAMASSLTIELGYDDSDWQSVGLTSEKQLRVFWMPEAGDSEFLEAEFDTVLNVATFEAPGDGVGGIYGDSAVAVGEGNSEGPLSFSASPNPFNPRTTIRFDLPAAGPIRLSIYDLAGRLVRVLVEGEVAAGSHEAVWDGRDASGRSAPSGSYLARLVAGGKVEGGGGEPRPLTVIWAKQFVDGRAGRAPGFLYYWTRAAGAPAAVDRPQTARGFAH